MNPLTLFDRTKEVKKVVLHPGYRKEIYAATIAKKHSEVSTKPMKIRDSGIDYAEQYIKKEEKELFEFSQNFRNNLESEYDEVSMVTDATHLKEETVEELTRVYRSYNFTHQSKVNLTIKTVREKIIRTVEVEPVTIIHGPTGCGKTTQVPQYIMDSCFEKKKPCNIIVTSPRRIAAISIAQRVCKERNWPLGSLVGYQVGLSRYVSQDTRLTYCTTGVLLNRLTVTKNMNDFTHIIIDEVHERSQDMDFLLLIIRKFLRSNSRTVKVILMSATFDVEKFSKYFSSYMGKKLQPAPVIDVIKSNYYEVKDFYLCQLKTIYDGDAPTVLFNNPEVSRRMIDLSIRLLQVIDVIDAQDASRDENQSFHPTVLVFLPGLHEIEEMHNTIINKLGSSKWDIAVLHSSITTEEQHQIFNPPLEGQRRVILSTNIAESSITVPDVKYVIDFCLTKQLTRDPNTNFQTLELAWASKSNCRQRAGRTGRLMDGRVYRLVPKRFYESLPDEPPPDILQAPLESVILQAKILDLDKPKALLALALDPPDLSSMESTILLLLETGGLLPIEGDIYDGELTNLGRVMGMLPVDIHISKMIMLGHVFSVLRETIIIGASMSVKNMFSSRFQQKLEAYSTKITWCSNSSSDGVAYFHAYNVWRREKLNARIKNNRSEIEWAQRNCLQIRILREIHALVEEIHARLAPLGIVETTGLNRVKWEESDVNLVLKIIFAGAFYPNYFITKPNDNETEQLKVLGGLDPLKTVYLQGWPVDQPLMLYAQRFQEAFKQCLTSDNDRVRVKSDNSSRVYIQFGRINLEDFQSGNTDTTGKVHNAVYRALKLRQIGNRINVRVLASDFSTKVAKELCIPEKSAILHFINAESSPISPPRGEIRPILPGLDITGFPLTLRRIVNPGQFWVSPLDEKTTGYSIEISKYINSLTESEMNNFKAPPPIGTLLLAPFESHNETIFRRALVQGITMENKNNKLAQVYFVDFGYNRRVQVKDLRQLPNNHPISHIPALAFECKLTNVKPFVFDSLSGEWSKEAKKVFINLLKEKEKIFGEVYSIVNSVVSLTLKYVESNVNKEANQEINVNEYLIREGFAQFCKENYLSDYNHQIREKASEFSPEMKLNYEMMQHNSFHLVESYVKPPPEEACNKDILLKGPYSPLEVELNGLTNAATDKKIKISEDSVNSVLLDESPENSQRRFLVAGSVTQGFVSGNLILRNTALMPNIPGLTSLLCLIFAPQIELRRNHYKTRYTSVLCGLGYDKKTGESLFPDHDMVIDFEVELGIDDLQNINRLRHWMGVGMFSDTTNDTIACQTKVKEFLFRILYKERLQIEYESDLKKGEWGRYPVDLFLVPGNVSTKHNIFKLHNALELEEKDEVKERLIDHLDALRSLAAQSFRESNVESIYCNLCNQGMFGIFQLRAHINAADHRMKENLLRCS